MLQAVIPSPDVRQDAAERLRAELELMDYVIAHDVQAPLRVIQSCYDELSAHPAASEGDDALQALGAEAARMKILLQGVLDYIRLETFATKPTPLDSGEIAAMAIGMLEEDIRRNGATVSCDPLPQVLGHRGRLTRLFTYLLDNALKFHGNQAPIIHISARPIGDKWEFCVEDNGIGIDEGRQTIIFQLFQRLHTAEAYPGHGIGLALSRKIVEAHGGKLWVESAPQKGSRFYFTLPAAAGNG